MKPAIFCAALISSLVLAGPVKRAIVTEYVYETVYVTATAGTGAGEDSGDGNLRTEPTLVSETTSDTQATLTPTPVASTTTTVANTPTSSSVINDVEPQPAAAPVSNGVSNILSSYATPILQQHNVHRDNHSVPRLVWDDDLANIAMQIAGSCVYAHNTEAGGGNYGQNIGAGAPDDEVSAMITNSMYNGEIVLYPGYGGEPDMSDFHNWGHFSQIVWASTKSVGCATKYCPNGLANTGKGVSPYFTVCNYKPAGNFGGQYSKNVLAPKGDASVTV